MPPLRAEVDPEYLPSSEQTLYKERRRKSRELFDRMLGLLVNQDGDGYITDVLLRSERAIYQVDGQEGREFTRAWLESDAQREASIKLKAESGSFKPATKEFDVADSFTHFSIEQDTYELKLSRRYGELTIEQQIKLLEDAAETVDLIEKATSEEKLAKN